MNAVDYAEDVGALEASVDKHGGKLLGRPVLELLVLYAHDNYLWRWGALRPPGELLSFQPTGAKSVGYEKAMVTFRLQQGKQLTASTLGVSLKV